MKDILNTYTLTELKKIISQSNIKRYSKLKKNELIELMTKDEHVNKFKHIKEKGKKERVKKEIIKKETKSTITKSELQSKRKAVIKKTVDIKDKKNELNIINTYIKLRESFRKGNVKFPKFVCSSWISEYIYNYILEKNSSDCYFGVMNFFNNKSALFIGFDWRKRKISNYDVIKMNGKKYGLKITRANFGGYDPTFIANFGFDAVYQKYKECKKKNLILCIPFNIGRSAEHRNMLIINHHSNTFERYEPHGSETTGILDFSTTFDTILKKMMNYLNKQYNEKFTYMSPIQTCPKKPKLEGDKEIGFQALEGREEPRGEDLYKSIMFREVKGYCCMWSFFMMDIRLRNPTTNPKKLFTDAYLLLRKGDKPFRTFIRAFTNEIMNDMNRQFSRTYDYIVRQDKRKKNLVIEEKEIDEEMQKKIRKFITDKEIQYKQKLRN